MPTDTHGLFHATIKSTRIDLYTQTSSSGPGMIRTCGINFPSNQDLGGYQGNYETYELKQITGAATGTIFPQLVGYSHHSLNCQSGWPPDVDMKHTYHPNLNPGEIYELKSTNHFGDVKIFKFYTNHISNWGTIPEHDGVLLTYQPATNALEASLYTRDVPSALRTDLTFTDSTNILPNKPIIPNGNTQNFESMCYSLNPFNGVNFSNWPGYNCEKEGGINNAGDCIPVGGNNRYQKHTVDLSGVPDSGAWGWDIPDGSGGNTRVIIIWAELGAYFTPVSWNCSGTSPWICSDPGDGTGTHATLAACNNNCPPLSWNCSGAPNWICSDPGDGTGTHATLAACNNICFNPSWNCQGPLPAPGIPIGTCTDPGDGSGPFTSLAMCQTNCQTSWNCQQLVHIDTCAGTTQLMNTPPPQVQSGLFFDNCSTQVIQYFADPTNGLQYTDLNTYKIIDTITNPASQYAGGGVDVCRHTTSSPGFPATNDPYLIVQGIRVIYNNTISNGPLWMPNGNCVSIQNQTPQLLAGCYYSNWGKLIYDCGLVGMVNPWTNVALTMSDSFDDVRLSILVHFQLPGTQLEGWGADTHVGLPHCKCEHVDCDCVEIFGPLGDHPTEADCLMPCCGHLPDTWDCVKRALDRIELGQPSPSGWKYTCVVRTDGSGQFNSLQNCKSNCSRTADIIRKDTRSVSTDNTLIVLPPITWLGKIVERTPPVITEAKDQAPIKIYNITGNHCNGYGDYKNYMYNLNPSPSPAFYDAGGYGTQTLTFPSVIWDNGNSIPQVGDYFWKLGIVWKIMHPQGAEDTGQTVPAGTPGGIQKANVGNGEFCSSHWTCNPIKPHLHCKKHAIHNQPGASPNLVNSFGNKDACLHNCPGIIGVIENPLLSSSYYMCDGVTGGCDLVNSVYQHPNFYTSLADCIQACMCDSECCKKELIMIGQNIPNTTGVKATCCISIFGLRDWHYSTNPNGGILTYDPNNPTMTMGAKLKCWLCISDNIPVVPSHPQPLGLRMEFLNNPTTQNPNANWITSPQGFYTLVNLSFYSIPFGFNPDYGSGVYRLTLFAANAIPNYTPPIDTDSSGFAYSQIVSQAYIRVVDTGTVNTQGEAIYKEIPLTGNGTTIYSNFPGCDSNPTFPNVADPCYYDSLGNLVCPCYACVNGVVTLMPLFGAGQNNCGIHPTYGQMYTDQNDPNFANCIPTSPTNDIQSG